MSFIFTSCLFFFSYIIVFFFLCSLTRLFMIFYFCLLFSAFLIFFVSSALRDDFVPVCLPFSYSSIFSHFFYNFTSLAYYHFSSTVIPLTSTLTFSSPLFIFLSFSLHSVFTPARHTPSHTLTHTPVRAPIQSAPVSRFLICISLQGESRLRHTRGRTG